METISCPSDTDLLPSEPTRTLDFKVQRHLRDCARCRQRLEELQRKQGVTGEANRGMEHLRTTLVWPQPRPAAPTERGQQLASLDAESLPATIGRYRVVSALDQGGQAQVYLALHPTLHKEVVIKWGRRPMAGDPEDRSGLLREGRLLADLEAPGLARVYDLDFADDRPFLVMEYIRGRNLKQYAEQERPSPYQAAAMLARLARALEAAHARGIIHQDIKPHNIVLNEAGKPYLIDFGLAKLCHAWTEETSAAGLTGTPAFMSPEQARGDHKHVGSRSDIFALGGVLYFLLVGKPPFDGNIVTDVLQRAARCDWDRKALRSSHAPRPLIRLCERALSANPEDRPATARQMAQQLESFVNRPRRRMLAAGFLIVLLLAAFVFWWRPWTSPAAAAVSEASLEIQVWRGQQSLRLLDALPLRSGDELQVFGQTPPGFEPALFWFDTEGRLEALPLETITAREGTSFRYPARSKAVQLTGPPGTEVVLVCARRSGPVDTDEIRKLFADHPWPKLPVHALVVLDRKQVRTLGSRAPGQLTDRPNSGIVEQAESLRTQLAARVDLVVGVAFPHQP